MNILQDFKKEKHLINSIIYKEGDINNFCYMIVKGEV